MALSSSSEEKKMPGFLLHLGATVMCAHAGQAQPVVSNPRVTVNGMPTVTLADSFVVAGCPFVPPAGNGPCVTSQRSEEHTSELQSPDHLVCRLLLEKKKKKQLKVSTRDIR